MNWLPCPSLPKKLWPPVKYKSKRAIKFEEHQRILVREGNPERLAFYEISWLFLQRPDGKTKQKVFFVSAKFSADSLDAFAARL